MHWFHNFSLPNLRLCLVTSGKKRRVMTKKGKKRKKMRKEKNNPILVWTNRRKEERSLGFFLSSYISPVWERKRGLGEGTVLVVSLHFCQHILPDEIKLFFLHFSHLISENKQEKLTLSHLFSPGLHLKIWQAHLHEANSPHYSRSVKNLLCLQ